MRIIVDMAPGGGFSGIEGWGGIGGRIEDF